MIFVMARLIYINNFMIIFMNLAAHPLDLINKHDS